MEEKGWDALVQGLEASCYEALLITVSTTADHLISTGLFTGIALLTGSGECIYSHGQLCKAAATTTTTTTTPPHHHQVHTVHLNALAQRERLYQTLLEDHVPCIGGLYTTFSLF